MSEDVVLTRNEAERILSHLEMWQDVVTIRARQDEGLQQLIELLRSKV